MKKSYLLLVLLCFILTDAIAQNPTVFYTPKNRTFNNGAPLPAHEVFIINGDVTTETSTVIIDVFKDDDLKNKIESLRWGRQFNQHARLFSVPMTKKLRSNREYTFLIKYFEYVGEKEQRYLLNMVQDALVHYVKAQTREKNGYLVFAKDAEQMVSELNKIVNEAYKLYDLEEFGFSGIVVDKIDQLNQGSIPISAATNGNDNTLVQEFTKLLQEELRYGIPQDLSKMTLKQEVYNYPTEKLPNVVSLNVGYSATFIDESTTDDMAYAPYVGLSFPLGNSKFAPFMNDMSFSLGVLLHDLEAEGDVNFTGPIVKLPVYAGLGYRVFDFMRINGGITLLEREEHSVDNFGEFESDKVMVKPFVGISIDINMWLGIGSQRPVRK